MLTNCMGVQQTRSTKTSPSRWCNILNLILNPITRGFSSAADSQLQHTMGRIRKTDCSNYVDELELMKGDLGDAESH